MYNYYKVSQGFLKVLTVNGRVLWQTAKLVKA